MLCHALGIAASHLVMPRQTHTTRVAVVDEALMVAGEAERAVRLQDVDALVTRHPGVCIGVNTADCVNIALADACAGVIGVAHAGWRGTAGKIAAAVRRPLLVPAQERWQIHLSAKGRCTVMYGMYGKIGSGAAPQNTVHYRTYRTPAD